MAVSGHLGQAPWTNVFWANLTGGVSATQANFDAWVSSFGEAYYTSLAPQIHQDVTIELAQGTLFQPNESALHSSHPMSHVGAQTDAALFNAASCAVLSWLTGVYWRGGKPRTYLPGVQVTDMANYQQLTPAAATGYQSAGTNFHTAVNALSSGVITQTQHGFVSFRTGNVDRPAGVFFPVSGCRVHHRIGTQRGRLGAWVA